MPKTSDFQTEESFNNLRSVIECQQPTADLYKFVGRIHFCQPDRGAQVTSPLSPEHVILRGSKLKETQFIYGDHHNSHLILFFPLLVAF